MNTTAGVNAGTGTEAPADTALAAANRRVDIEGATLVYRRFGNGDAGARPLLCLQHFRGNLDNWDPALVDRLAADREVVVVDNRGVGGSTGAVPDNVEDMARDVLRFMDALGLGPVDLLGFSLGGFISQVIALEAPQLLRRIILAGTGPAGGVGIDKVTRVTIRDMLKAALTLKHPEYYLFFTGTANGRRSARDFLRRLSERTVNRDKPVSIGAFRSQLRAIHAWGCKAPDDLSRIKQPVLVANGDRDKMVPSSNSVDMARRLPNAQLVIYDDAGHGGIFQYHQDFVEKALSFFD